MWCDTCKKDAPSEVFRTFPIGGAVVRERECSKCHHTTDTIEVPIDKAGIESLKGAFTTKLGGKWNGSASNGATIMTAMAREGIVVLLRPITPATKNRLSA